MIVANPPGKPLGLKLVTTYRHCQPETGVFCCTSLLIVLLIMRDGKRSHRTAQETYYPFFTDSTSATCHKTTR